MANRKATIADFWKKVRIRGLDVCWMWRGAKDRDGYGVAYKRGRAHRVVWFETRGPVPSSVLILHRCDTPACVNPCHLFSGTNKDNSDDKIRKGRGRWAHGTAHYLAKLTPADVVEIRRAVSLGVQQTALARVYGVKPPIIFRVVHRMSWKHVP